MQRKGKDFEITNFIREGKWFWPDVLGWGW